MRQAWRPRSRRRPGGSGSRSSWYVSVSAVPERERVHRLTRPDLARGSAASLASPDLVPSSDAGSDMGSALLAATRVARALEIDGVVQGVGFRPFVYRLGNELGLDGVVWNAAGRVRIVAAGEAGRLDRFAARLASDAPPRARVERVEVRALVDGERQPAPGDGFSIEESVASASAVRLFPPDIATCDDCIRELFDPLDRRYRYPFINCTNCGPRATIIDELPYDRAQTSMREFPLCAACSAEYRDPADRRFHAEPVACRTCGPRLAYRRPGEPAPSEHEEAALAAAVADLAAGRIVAVKGLGGYHLACDATDPAAVARLRDRKQRWAKPFAVMVRDVRAARALARITREEGRLLLSPARPIVLVEARRGTTRSTLPSAASSQPASRSLQTPLAEGVANGNRRIGLFLPYTPLHHLLLEAVGRPIVLTSGNLADEPLVTDDAEALVRLAGLADAFLAHDRQIRARYDDSVTRVMGRGRTARESIVRRGRGYAPDPVRLPVEWPADECALAVGAELKHTFALVAGSRAHVAPHIGDLEDLATHRAFEDNLAHLSRLLALEPGWAVHDLHPSYLSTQYAVNHFPADRRIGVQHHHAHVASCAAEHGVTGPFIGVAYDGLGMGDDGTFWGGEILVADLVGYHRVARFGRAPMPGGASAVKRPYRMALGYLFGAEMDGDRGDAGVVGTALAADDRRFAGAVADGLASSFLARLDPREVEVVRIQVARGLNAPVASSAGRLFDAASSLLGLRDVAEFEAQAAIDLEMAADPGARGYLPYRIVRRDGLLVYDPRPTLLALLEGGAAGVSPGRLAGRFQGMIAAVTRELCAETRRATGLGVVCLSGGVFQNAWLTATLIRRLSGDGFEVHVNEQVPVNDGGIAYGQAAVGAARRAASRATTPATELARAVPATPPAVRGVRGRGD
jgi:hydrogenase maturation protein HypF